MPRQAPQEYDEMVNTMTEKKAGRLYREDSAGFVDERISAIISGTTEELAKIARGEKLLSLSDYEAVKERTLIYMRACEAASSIPTFSGLARSFGMSTEALNKHLREHPGSKTTEWLQMAHDAFADALAEAATRGLTQPVFSIFSLKARSGWRDSIVIETPARDPLGDTISAEEIERKYSELPEE